MVEWHDGYGEYEIARNHLMVEWHDGYLGI